MSISNEIKGYIAGSGESVSSVADKIGITRSALSQQINNESIRYKNIKEIAKLLGYKIVWIKEE